MESVCMVYTIHAFYTCSVHTRDACTEKGNAPCEIYCDSVSIPVDRPVNIYELWRTVNSSASASPSACLP